MLMKSQRLVVAFCAWALFVLALLVLLNSPDYESFFILCLIGFLVIAGLSGPTATKLRWRSRVNVVILAATAIFIMITLKKIVELIT